MKTKRPRQRPAKGKALVQNSSLVKDLRPISIIGTLAGVVVASDRASEHWKASSIAAAWRGSGLAVEISESSAG